MFRKWREARNEEGFTLIELLVVVIIIGILAAIAIPAFLNQRERAWQAELTSAVRNAALDIESEATVRGGMYPSNDDGAAAATEWVNLNVNDAAATAAIDANSTPISNLVYVVYDSAGTAITATDVEGSGFLLCMEHASISGTASTTYLGGNQGTGVQAFNANAGCS